MIEEILHRLISILKQKKSNLNEMLLLSQKADFKGVEDEITQFVEYIDNRQKIIDVCSKLDSDYQQLIEQQDINELKKNKFYDNIELLLKEISDLAIKIFQLDKPINDKMNILTNEIKLEIKKINSGKKMNKSYFGRVSSSGAAFFDKKN